MVGIRDLRMPKSCSDCRLMANGWCYAAENWDHAYDDIDMEKRPSWCPLVDLSAWEDDGK